MSYSESILVGMPNIYLASTLSNYVRVRELIASLGEMGFSVTYDWTPHGDALYGSDPKPLPDNEQERVKFLGDIGIKEAEGVDEADVVLAIEPTNRGSHFEMGVAWRKIPIVILDDTDSKNRPVSFHFMPGIYRTNTLDDAIKTLKELTSK